MSKDREAEIVAEIGALLDDLKANVAELSKILGGADADGGGDRGETP